jgi:DGQHR domain-containing protein
MRVNAFRITQSKMPLYLTAMPAKEVIGHSRVDTWNPETGEGYQRGIGTTRANKAGRYLTRKNGIFPQSIVLNVRKKLSFRKTESTGNHEYGELEIPEDSMPLWEVDGQHRIAGLEYAIKENPEFVNYPVSVTILNLRDPYEEMKQFYSINTEMKGVRTDLAERRISETVAAEGEGKYRKHGKTRELFVARAAKIADLINEQKNQPWHNAIQLPNESKTPEKLIPQRSFVVSLKPVLRVTEGLEAGIAARIISNYWSVLGELYPNAFKNPHDYLLQKTLGVFVFHLVFPRVYTLCGGDYTKEKIGKTLSKIAEENPESSWHKDGEYKPYGGMKGFNYLAAKLEDHLGREIPDIRL